MAVFLGNYLMKFWRISPVVPTLNNYCILEFIIRTGNTGNQLQFIEENKKNLIQKRKKILE